MYVKQALTQFEFFTLMQIRATVFMHEQKVDPLIEIDDYDATCKHFILYDDQDKIVGTCRILEQDTSWHIGRLAIVKEARHQHYGLFLLKEIEALAKQQSITRLDLGAQIQAKPFYEKVGYTTYGEPYVEANIDHINMEKVL